MIPRADLLAALEAVKGAVAAKNFMPILTHILISGKTVLGYDSEIGIKFTMGCDTGVEFNVKFDTFYNLLKALDQDEMDIKVDGKKVTLQCGRHRSTMVQIVEEEFPRPEVAPVDEWCKVPAGFKEALERVVACASLAESNRVTSAILVRDSRCYGTDGTRAARCTLDELKVNMPMLLSRKAVEEIIRLGNPVRLVVAGPWAVFDYTNLAFLARLREGEQDYPPVDKVFDKLGDLEVVPVPEGLFAILSRLKLFGGERPEVRIENNLLGCELTAKEEKGDAAETIDSQPTLNSKKAFSPDKVLDSLPYVDGMNWGANRTDPLYFKGDSAGFELLVMPINIS